jgi:hypothetical protein
MSRIYTMRHAKNLSGALAIAVALSLTGCVTSREVAKVPFVPVTAPAIGSALGLHNVRIGSVSVLDQRLNSGPGNTTLDAAKLVNQRDTYGITADGVYALEKPLAEYVTQAFEAGLQRRGVALDPGAPVSLEVRVLKVDDSISCCSGLLQTAVMKLSIDAEATLYDTSAKHALSKKRVLATGDVKAKGLYFAADDYMRALPGILDDLVETLASDPAFQESLKQRSRVEAE